MAITLAQAEAKLVLILAAYDKAVAAQSYSISSGGGGRSTSRQDLDSLEKAISFWEKKVERLTRGGIRVRGVVPIG